MTITARYPGTCSVCGQAIKPGQKIEWSRGAQPRHTSCPAGVQPAQASPAIPADAITLVGCGSSGRYQDASVIRNPYAQDDEPRYLVVLSSRRQHVGEDSMSFGDDDDCGYVLTTYCRPASNDEAAPVIAAEAEAARKHELQRRVRAIAEQVREQGERPEQAEPVGERLFDTQTIYGGGDWFVVEAGALWYVRNNHGDGDMWSANTVGGYGIGWVLRGEQAAALTSELYAIEAELEPGRAQARQPRDEAGTAHERFFAPHADTTVWSAPAADARLQAPPRLPWVRLAGPVHAGQDADGQLWLASTGRDVAEYVYAGHGTSRYGYLHGEYAVALRYDVTPERLAAFEAFLPAWCGPEGIAAYHAANAAAWAVPEPVYPGQVDGSHDHIFTDDFRRLNAAWRAEQDAARAAVWADLLRPGRYQIGAASGHRGGFAATLRDALWHAAIDGIALQDVTCEPELELVQANRESPIDGRPFGLWSDGQVSIGAIHSAPTGPDRSADAKALLGAAIRQPWWQQEGRWHPLVTITAISASEQLARREEGGRGGGEEWTLERLTCTSTLGLDLVLYRLREQGWSMGEDGDTWETARVYLEEPAARAAYAQAVHRA